MANEPLGKQGSQNVNLFFIDPRVLVNTSANGDSLGPIASKLFFGEAATGPVNTTVNATSIASAEAFGSQQAQLNVTNNGISSEESVGTLQGQLNSALSAVSSEESFGSSSASLNTSATGIAS